MDDLEDRVRRLANHIVETNLQQVELGPEFFYPSLPLCVVDAVFSISVTYKSTQNTVTRFCERQGWNQSPVKDGTRTRGEHSIGDMLDLLEGLTPDKMADDLFGNRQRTSSTSGILKADAVSRFCLALRNAGIDDFINLSADNLSDAESQVREIPGQKSGISFSYFCMLCGNDNLVKPDRMVQRYIARALSVKPEKVRPDRIGELMRRSVDLLISHGQEWSPRVLDHSIWSHERAS